MPKISKLYQERLNKPFEVSSVCRADLISEGFDEEKVANLKDYEMEYVASKMGDAFCDTSYWIALREIVNRIFEEK